MDTLLKRPYRKNVRTKGLIFIDDKEQEAVVQNISISGALVTLNNQWYGDDMKHIFSVLSGSTTVDIFLPELQLSGEAEVVRVDTLQDNHIALALEFKNLDCQYGKWHYKRKSYRKSLRDSGRIIINRKCYKFYSTNASVEGLMIQIPEALSVKEGMVTLCEFRRLGINCKIKVVWVKPDGDNATLLGLQYLNIEKEKVKGVPHFYL